MITVYMTEELQEPFEEWLEKRDLELTRVPPHEVASDESYYAVLPKRQT